MGKVLHPKLVGIFVAVSQDMIKSSSLSMFQTDNKFTLSMHAYSTYYLDFAFVLWNLLTYILNHLQVFHRETCYIWLSQESSHTETLVLT